MKNFRLFKSGYLVLVLMAFAISSCTSHKMEEEKPNFLFILADDFGYHDLSCMGSEYYENRDTAFFAYLSFYAVHAPIQTTQKK